MTHRTGFTLLETIFAALITLVGALIVTEALHGSEGASHADINKSRAMRTGDDLLRRIGQEVSQSSADIDPSLPPDEQQRLWIIGNGITFQRVAGHELDGDLLTVTWSPRISYLHNPLLRQVTRSVEGGNSRVIARGVTAFSCQRDAAGQVTVKLETRAGAAQRGQEARHRHRLRIVPRNQLR